MNNFCHEYAKLDAVLSARVGVQHIESIEDAVLLALMKALDTWTLSVVPEKPSAWLYKAAKNHLVAESHPLRSTN